MALESLTVIACSVLKAELTTLQASGRLSHRVHYMDSALHMRPEELQVRLREAVREERAAGRRVLLIYGDCSSCMQDLHSEGQVERVAAANCAEMLLGKPRYKTLIKSGAFLLFPEWAGRWREVLLSFPGMDGELTRKMMRDMHSRFVYLDTGVSPIPRGALEECGAFFGIPCEVQTVGLDGLEGSVHDAMERLSGGETKRSEVDLGPTAVMMLDIITGVLRRPGDIGQTSLQLSQKLRELTGSRMVILAVQETLDGGSPGFRVLAVNPARHAPLAETDFLKRIIGESLRMDRVEVPQAPKGPLPVDGSLGFDPYPCLILPLRSGEERVGSLLSLGLMDLDFLDSILEIEDVLSGVIAVVLKNALLQERQQRLLQELEREVNERMSAEARARLLLDSAAEGIYGIDPRGDCTFANQSGLRILGFTDPSEVLGKNMHRLVHHSYPDGRPMPIEECAAYRTYSEGKGMHRDDEVFWKPDGTSIPVEYWSTPQVVDGVVQGAVVTFNDTTERRRYEEMLASQRQRLSYILEGTDAGTWEWNVQTGRTAFNERWAAMVGHTMEDLEPTSIETWRGLLHPEDRPMAEELLQRHFRGEIPYIDCELRMLHKNGSWVWVLDRGKVVTWTGDGKPLMMCGTHQDITERKQAEERIRYMATHDALTGLPSLRLAKDRLSMALSLARRQKNLAAVMFIDLDGFKSVNDTLGHEAGDLVLKETAQRLLSCVRATDTVARIGGDEFLILATSLHCAENAAEIAGKAIHLAAQPFFCNGRQASIGASIGIALYPTHGEDDDQLLKKADAAMYKVKVSGKNGFRFADA